MHQHHVDVRVFGPQVVGDALGEIDGAVLAACAAAADAEVGELALEVVVHAHVGDGEKVLLERLHLGVLLQVLDDGAVQAGH